MLQKLASWNIRGAHAYEKQIEIKNIIHSFNLKFIVIFETKLDHSLSYKLANFINPS